MDGSSDRVRVICGPTAAGKTRIATWLASRFPASIVSADSRQVYRGFDIGTAKPSFAERAAIPHFGIDVLSPADRSSAAWWAASALEWLGEIEGAARAPLVVGGTGLYLRALFGSLFEEPPIDGERRRQVQHVLASLPLDELRRWTRALDAERAHLGRTQLLRAIEIALLTGNRLSTLHRSHARAPARSARYLLVDPGNHLAGDIAERTQRMLDQGWPEEVVALRTSVPADAPAWNASGYRAVLDMVEGRMTRAATLERIVIETRQYAKRQRTWFRHQLAGDDVTTLDPMGDGWQHRALAWWHGDAP